MLKTLIVEDNERFRQSLKEMLINRFPSVTIEEADNGEDALRRVDTLAPDLIFMDIKLPGENGLTVTKRIKQRYPGITVVILTYYDSPEHRQAADQCGADYFLPKSTSIEAVVEIVQFILSKKNAGPHNSRAS